jgi:hypothetical protein
MSEEKRKVESQVDDDDTRLVAPPKVVREKRPVMIGFAGPHAISQTTNSAWSNPTEKPAIKPLEPGKDDDDD